MVGKPSVVYTAFLFCRRQYIVKFDLHPGLGYMKVNDIIQNLNKSELPYLFEHNSNFVPSVHISFSHHLFVSYRLSLHLSSWLTKRKSTKFNTSVNFMANVCFHTTRCVDCVRNIPSNYSRVCLTTPNLSGITIYRNRLRTFRTLVISVTRLIFKSF